MLTTLIPTLLGALLLVAVPVVLASLVWLSSDAAKRAGVRVPRIMRAGPWR